MTSRLALRSGIGLAAVQAVLMLSTGVLFWIDRQISPRAWVATAPVDPNLPIRGRYITMTMLVPLRSNNLIESDGELLHTWQTVQLGVEGDRLIAQINDQSTRNQLDGRIRQRGDSLVVNPDHELAFFIPPDVQDPSIQPDGRTLWVEVTLPRFGAPRPIQLGLETNGLIEPLPLR